MNQLRRNYFMNFNLKKTFEYRLDLFKKYGLKSSFYKFFLDLNLLTFNSSFFRNFWNYRLFLSKNERSFEKHSKPFFDFGIIVSSSSKFKEISSQKYPFYKCKVIKDVSKQNLFNVVRDLKCDYIFILEDSSILSSNALFQLNDFLKKNPSSIVYSDHDFKGLFLRKDPKFKPDFSLPYFLSYNYIGDSVFFKRDFLIKNLLTVNFFDSYKYELILRAYEQNLKISHLSKFLFHNEACSKLNFVSEMNIVKTFLDKNKFNASVSPLSSGVRRIKFNLKNEPSVSIIIPNKDQPEYLFRCINSILNKTKYNNYEILIVENSSTNKKTLRLYDQYKKLKNVRILNWIGEFNYSKVNNFAAKFSKGKYLLFLNNDTEIINSDWLNEMISCFQFNKTGIVGAKLLYSDNTIQHGGVVLNNPMGFPLHSHRFYPSKSQGYMNRLACVQNYLAVTAACMLIDKNLFNKLNGFEEEYPLAYSDLDLCLKVITNGYFVLWSPFASLIHHESKTRGADDNFMQIKRNNLELSIYNRNWNSIINRGDSNYNYYLAE